MTSQLSQFFRKNGGSSSAEPTSKEDLEWGHGSLAPQTPPASGYQSSPSRVYLPETRAVPASTVTPTPTSSSEHFPLTHFSGRNDFSTSKVVGYLPRATLKGSLPLVTPSRHLPNIESASPTSPFDTGKHGKALRRLETHGSLKTIPCGQDEGPAVNRDSVSWSEIGRVLFDDDDDTCQALLSSQGDCSKVVNLPEPPKTGSVHRPREALPSFVFPLPNAEAEDYDQFQQVMHRSQAAPIPDRAISPKNFPGGPIDADTSLDHISRTIPDAEEIDEYLWSPAPSDDGLEAPSAPHTPISRHAPSDVLHASPISGIPSASNGDFSHLLELYSKDHTQSRSSSSGVPGALESSFPHIDVLIPMGSIDLDSHSEFLASPQRGSAMGSSESSGILFRYSGLITDGLSARPMSESELEEEVLHSLGNRVKTRMSILSSGNSTSQVDHHTTCSDQSREHQAPNAEPKMSPFDCTQISCAGSGPGSSQTSSSMSTDRYGGQLSSNKSRFNTHGLSPARTRCPTPPLLFGRNAIRSPGSTDGNSYPTLGNGSSRFELNSKAIRPQNSARLPTALSGLGEEDWETVSARTEAASPSFDRIALEAKTGSSLADTSDSGSLSLSKETVHPFRRMKLHPVTQHAVLPRQNHSFMLLKNSQTGDLVQVPQYQYAIGHGSLPNNNAGTQLASRVRAASTYQHPSPLRVEHRHPFTSSLDMVNSASSSARRPHSNYVVTEQKHLDSDLSSLDQSESIQEIKETQAQNLLYKTTQDTSNVREHVVNSEYNMESEEQSHRSSTWLSTVSEAASREPSLPENGITFTETVAGAGNGVMNNTLGRGGNKEVGSSLADASSPGADFSSSPVPLTSSPIQYANASPLVGQGSLTQAVQHDLDSRSQHLLGNFHRSLASSFNHKDSATPATNTQNHSRSLSAFGPQMEHENPSPRRRRSSSESHSELMDSTSAPKFSALESSSSSGRAQQPRSCGLLLRHPFPRTDENGALIDPSDHNLVQLSGRQLQADETSLQEPNTSSPPSSSASAFSRPVVPSSMASLPFVRNGVLHTDVPPPMLDHPVYGRNCPWDRVRPGYPSPGSRPVPGGRPRLQRPVARAESPHLHRIPHQLTPELLERSVLLSQIYLILSMAIPPVAIIYGHGYMDGVMRFHTAGQIDDFRKTEKTIALYWGYGVSAISMLVIVIVIIIISASG
ncbi:hypothetical protein BDR22DRAFT_891850 [Usnea florida]